MFHNLREKYDLLDMNRSNAMRELLKQLHYYEFQNRGDRFPIEYIDYVSEYYDRMWLITSTLCYKHKA